MVLVDGGVLNPLPLDIVKRQAGDLLIAVNVNSGIPYQPPSKLLHPPEHEKHYGKVRAALNERWMELIDFYHDKYSNQKKPKPAQVKMFDVISESINLSQDKLSKMNIEKHKPDILIEVSYKIASAFDYFKAEEIIEAGRQACRKALENKYLIG
jgi:NTE family protein